MIKPIASTKNTHMQRNSTLKCLTSGFSDKEKEEVTQCEGSLELQFKPKEAQDWDTSSYLPLLGFKSSGVQC